MPSKTIALVNTTGRQAASVARVADALGYSVRAQLKSREGTVAQELESLENITILEGPLEDNNLVGNLFKGAQLAFINTVPYGDEIVIGKSLATAAKKAGVVHYVYSSMPDHAIYEQGWPSLPLWSCKFAVENYIRQVCYCALNLVFEAILISRQIGLPATFVYAGIYNNNFTSLPYPLFCMSLQQDGTFQWKAPFHADTPLPWLDAEHDVGPAIIQIFRDGPRQWAGHR